jgi:hypothetical protein
VPGVPAGGRPRAPRTSGGRPHAHRTRPRPRHRPLLSPESEESLELGEPLDPAAGHVEAEAELVAESADPGAVDGAGAELTVDEPWPGHNELTAADVVARLPAVSAAELAVTELYETTHRQRPTVLVALEEHLRARQQRARGGPEPEED